MPMTRKKNPPTKKTKKMTTHCRLHMITSIRRKSPRKNVRVWFLHTRWITSHMVRSPRMRIPLPRLHPRLSLCPSLHLRLPRLHLHPLRLLLSLRKRREERSRRRPQESLKKLLLCLNIAYPRSIAPWQTAAKTVLATILQSFSKKIKSFSRRILTSSAVELTAWIISVLLTFPLRQMTVRMLLLSPQMVFLLLLTRTRPPSPLQ